MTAPADAQRLQAKKRDQYASTLKRAFALAYAKTTPSTAVEWAALYVNVEARVAKSLRDKTDAIGDRAAFQSGYGFFHTHELRNGALEKRHHPKVQDRTAEQQCWEAFCERTSRDARSEARSSGGTAVARRGGSSSVCALTLTPVFGATLKRAARSEALSTGQARPSSRRPP